MYKYGICSVCQEKHEIRRSAIGMAQDHYGVIDDGNEGGYVMLPHCPTFAPNMNCAGEGMTPQCVVKSTETVAPNSIE